MPHQNTAFPETAQNIAEMLEHSEIDDDAFEQTLQPCELSVCGGTCCHDGAYLSSEEAAVIRGLADSERDSFVEMGLELPEQVVVFGKWRDVASGPKTATWPVPMREKVKDYPEHFPETNCVFLLDDARCGLQVLAEERDLPKWYFKPFTCWMHPISISRGASGQATITLYSERTDPQRYADYDGFVCRTHCGRKCEGGTLAREVLAEELEALNDLKQFSSSEG